MQCIIWQQLINLQHNTYVHKSCIMMHNTMYSFRVQAYILIKSIVVDADHVFHPKQPLKDATTKKKSTPNIAINAITQQQNENDHHTKHAQLLLLLFAQKYVVFVCVICFGKIRTEREKTWSKITCASLLGGWKRPEAQYKSEPNNNNLPDH